MSLIKKYFTQEETEAKTFVCNLCQKYTVRLHGAPCSSLDGVTASVGRPIRFEIRFERKKRFAGL